MKKSLKIMLMVMLTVTSGWLAFPRSKSKVIFFAPGSFYVYVMGSYNHFVPPGGLLLLVGPRQRGCLCPGFRAGLPGVE